MTASALIAGTLRTIPDAPFAPSPESGVPTHANFQSVLEQYRAPRESDSKSEYNQDARQQKHKESDPTSTLAVPQPETPAVDTPRLILPLTASIRLRQNAAASPDDTANQDSTAAAAPTAEPLGIENALSTPANMRSMLDLRNLRSAHGSAQPKTQASLQDSTPSRTSAAPLDQTAPADPSIRILPVASSTTFEQAPTIVQNSSTVSEAPDTVSTSTSDRGAAFQYRSSNERPAETAVINRASQREQQNVADSTQAVTIPIPGMNTVEPQPPIHRSSYSNAPRQDAKASDTGSAVSQDSSTASGTDPKTATLPTVERADDTAAAPDTGALAFAARLTPTAELQPPASDSTRSTEPLPSSQAPLQLATPATAKQIATGADLPADAHSDDGEGQSDKDKTSDRFARPDTLLPQMHVAVADQTALPANNHASTSPLQAAAQMDQVIDPPTATPNTNHDITVRIPDSTDQGAAVRFVERAGEIHVSVRTGDVEMAQSLRGGLNELVNHLEDGGIRTEVWQPGPGSNAAFSQNDSHQPFADPDGSNGRQYSSGSNSEQEAKQQNKPRWVEELESSIGNPNSKETTQLLWQA